MIDGTYFSDSFFNDDIHVKNVTMALGQEGKAHHAIDGMLGIGFKALQASNYYTYPRFTYSSLLDQMHDRGLIQTRSFSLWLDNLHDDTGVVLFGGVDHEKYTGPLVPLAIQKNPRTKQIDAMFVQLTGLSVNQGTPKAIKSSYDLGLDSQPALLDSGSSYSHLPDHIVEGIYTYLGADFGKDGSPIVPCSTEKDYTLAFTFGTGKDRVTIYTSIYELIAPIAPHSDKCLLFVAKKGNLPTILGDSFLRSAYVVYHLDIKQIALAQANFQATATVDGDKIVPITGNKIPGTTGSPKPKSGSAASSRASLLLVAISSLATLLYAAAA